MSKIKISGLNSEERMREINQRLQQKEARKARELLTLAGQMSHYDALMFVRADIEKKMNGYKK